MGEKVCRTIGPTGPNPFKQYQFVLAWLELREDGVWPWSTETIAPEDSQGAKQAGRNKESRTLGSNLANHGKFASKYLSKWARGVANLHPLLKAERNVRGWNKRAERSLNERFGFPD